MMKFKIAIVSLMMICTQSIFSQTKTVTGTVLDSSGTSLPGVSVIIEGTSNGVSTDFDGNYSIDNVNDTDNLVFGFIGMISQTVVASGAVIDVTLENSAESLEEVVIVGYGTQSRAAVTGAMSSVGAEEIAALPITNAEQALQGRAAGVTVTNSGSPGSNPVVRIRGMSTFGDNGPLYVVDGVIVGNLSGISPSDIESVNILKDASTTAVYGAQGSNGVIMVTTKSGKAGKAKITFNSYVGSQTISERYDVLNTEQYLEYALDAFGVTPGRSSDWYSNDTDYQDALFQTGLMQNYDLGASGGNENSRYRISAGYLSQEGAIIETGFERFSFRANSDFTKGKFKLGESMAVSFSEQNPENTGGRSLIEHAIKAAPYLPIYNENNLGGYQGPTNAIDGQDAENPIRVQSHGDFINKTTSIIGNIYGEFEIIEGLKFKSQVGLDYYAFRNNSFVPSYNDDSEGQNTHNQTYANITKNTGTGSTVILTNSLNYQKTYNEVHNVELLVLAEDFHSKFESINATSQNAISDEVDQISNDNSNIRSFSNEYIRRGIMGRLNYNYKNKYIFAASYRRDGGSRFGANQRYGNFSSIAAGWNISKEDFMSESIFSNLKLRASYGTVGNDKISDYAYASTLVTAFNYPINGAAASGTTAEGLANADLKWEESTMTNIGLDFGLFNEVFTGSIEYYNKTSNDLLFNLSTVNSLGFHKNSVPSNVGNVENKGMEVTLGYNDNEGDFTWSANFNIGTSKNEVISLGSGDFFEGGNFENANISRTEAGQPLLSFYGLVTDGIYQNQAEVDAVFTANPSQNVIQPGDVRFIDLNGDGDITSADRTFIGNPHPEVTYGLNLSGAFKNFDANIFLSGVSGVDIYNTNIYDLQGMPRLFNAGVEVLNRWTPTNPSTTIPRAGGPPQNTAISDRFVEDGSFTRLKNFTIGYTIPESAFGNANISNFRVYLSGQNLVTITDYSGLDPELGNNSLYEFGIDRGNYPQPKSFLMGIQVSF